MDQQESLDPTGSVSRYVIEEDQRLFDSFLWNRQRQYFENEGVAAWNTGAVPHYVTSSPTIARAYARVVLTWIRECCLGYSASNGAHQSLDRSQRIHIVELGAGSGRFAFYFLKHFTRLVQTTGLQDVPITYVMTDLAESNVAHWQAHPQLQPFVEAGLLDFACLDATQSRSIELRHSGTILSPDTPSNPLVLLANYFFDNIPQDVFTVRDGELFESRVTFYSEQPENDLNDPDMTKRLKLDFVHHHTSSNFYDDPSLNDILRDYAQRLPDVTFLFPVVALQCLQFFRDLSGGRMLLLTADKGFDSEEMLMEQDGLGMGTHGGSISLMMNYDALGRFTQNTGGQFLRPRHRYVTLAICAFLFGLSSHETKQTQQAFDDQIGDAGPDDFYVIQSVLERNCSELSADELLSWLRVSQWDFKVVSASFSTITKHLDSATDVFKRELFTAIQRVWEDYFWIGESDDVAACLGSLLGQMEYFAEALEFFHHSLALYGDKAQIHYLMAVCHYQLKQPKKALEHVHRALAMEPVMKGARALRLKLDADQHARAHVEDHFLVKPFRVPPREREDRMPEISKERTPVRF